MTIDLTDEQRSRLIKACLRAAFDFDNDGIGAILGIGSAEADAYRDLAKTLGYEGPPLSARQSASSVLYEAHHSAREAL